ncbi:hypothetical protein [Neokomagataea thailandica]|uniref:LysM domain-containing protein n=1 Tax=Neokomagataea tanensis NBRC 106556 TaxID=1223519 RepID=A0ABQ0QGP7_9PROT|nr:MULTISPECIES: hypothetical protein [Neokomagataea]GBR44223.1 hypothetical protein AA106556_0354 [Neokomagataea tanensis NBRC 106556]
MKNIYIGSGDNSLFHLSSKCWGDPLFWWKILEANQLTDYSFIDLEQNIKIKIPEKPAVESVGLPWGEDFL